MTIHYHPHHPTTTSKQGSPCPTAVWVASSPNSSLRKNFYGGWCGVGRGKKVACLALCLNSLLNTNDLPTEVGSKKKEIKRKKNTKQSKKRGGEKGE